MKTGITFQSRRIRFLPHAPSVGYIRSVFFYSTSDVLVLSRNTSFNLRAMDWFLPDELVGMMMYLLELCGVVAKRMADIAVELTAVFPWQPTS